MPDFGGEFERFEEDVVADAGGQIDERLLGDGSGAAEMLLGFVARVGGFALAGLRSGHVGHVDRNFDLQNVHAVLRLREFFHALGRQFGLLARELDGLFVLALFVADEFEEERNVRSRAFAADALDPGVLDVVDLGRNRMACSTAES